MAPTPERRAVNAWRDRLLIAVIGFTWGGYAWIFWGSAAARSALASVSAVFVIGLAATFRHYRRRLTPRLITANLALGSIVHLGLAGGVALGQRALTSGLIPTVAEHWVYLLIGLLSLAGASFTWTRARGGEPGDAPPPARHQGGLEPPPPPSEALQRGPDWQALASQLSERGDPAAEAQRMALERIAAALETPGSSAKRRVDDALRTLRQEVMRLEARSAAASRGQDDDDVLSQAAELLEWGVQKLPELRDLDLSDLIMGKTVADIRSKSDRVERVLIDHRELKAIHLIDRPSAEEKCEARAEAARAALPLLRANGMKLTEDLIAAHEALSAFQSVTGFQVVDLGAGGGFVTFEGNGRREALQRAFGDETPVQVECRRFFFDDPEVERTIQRRVRRVRRWKHVRD